MNGDLPTDLSSVGRLYDKSLDQYGAASPGVGWGDPESHRLRFAKLAQAIESANSAITVNDLGCGYGALYGYLLEQRYAVAKFRGYDISENMLKEAVSRFPSGEFHRGSALDALADFSFACGIFNVRLEHSESTWLGHIERTLDNLNDFSSRGFAFNLLSTYVDYREPHLYYGDPLYFFDRCRRRYGRYVALLHDYPLYEWTMLVRK